MAAEAWVVALPVGTSGFTSGSFELPVWVPIKFITFVSRSATYLEPYVAATAVLDVSGKKPSPKFGVINGPTYRSRFSTDSLAVFRIMSGMVLVWPVLVRFWYSTGCRAVMQCLDLRSETLKKWSWVIIKPPKGSKIFPKLQWGFLFRVQEKIFGPGCRLSVMLRLWD